MLLIINKCSWSSQEEIEVKWDEDFNVNLRSGVSLVNPENSPRVALLELYYKTNQKKGVEYDRYKRFI